MKKIIEALIGLIVLSGLVATVYYGYPYLTRLKVNGSILNKDAVSCAVTCSGDGRTVYILESGRLIKSVDGGRTWEIIEVKMGE